MGIPSEYAWFWINSGKYNNNKLKKGGLKVTYTQDKGKKDWNCQKGLPGVIPTLNWHSQQLLFAHFCPVMYKNNAIVWNDVWIKGFSEN